MKPFQEIIEVINKLKKNGTILNKEELLAILEAAKTITKHEQILNRLIQFVNTLSLKQKSNKKKLTQRELEVLELIGNTLQNKEIATMLSLKTSTIETHRKNIRKKLGLVGNGKLLEYAILFKLNDDLL